MISRIARRLIDIADLIGTYGIPPRNAFVFFGGLGDQLILTTVAHELWQRSHRRVTLMSAQPDLFIRNPSVAAVWPIDPVSEWVIRNAGGKVTRVTYPHPPGKGHMISAALQSAGITGRVAIRPYLHLMSAERRAGRIASRQVCIQTSSLTARYPMRTKQWLPERFQQVADAIRGSVTVIQIGSPADPPLSGVIDLRGRIGIRRLAAVLANSDLLVGPVSMPMHLARAVDCRAVIVYGGREGPEQSGYVCNINVFSDLPCSRCWLEDGCPHSQECMTQITSTQVIDAVERQLGRVGEPLVVQHDDITGNDLAQPALKSRIGPTTTSPLRSRENPVE
jgi:hypothetical protein